MKNIIKINTFLGWTLLTGIIITQFMITKVTFEMGRMAPFYAFLTFIIFLPFICTAIVSILNRERQSNKIKIGIKVGIFFQVVLPIILPLFFDKEFIYLCLLGMLLGVLLWYFRKNIEVQLLILNGIGVTIWISISLIGIISS